MDVKTIKGQVVKISTRGEGDKKTYGLYIGGNWYNGFGEPSCKEGEEVEFQYKETEVAGKIYRNILKPSRTAEKIAETVNTKVGAKIDDIVAALNLPKISVMVEKTVQENQFEPKKVSCHISMSVNEVTPEQISYLIKMAEIEVLNISHTTKGAPQPSKFPSSELIYASEDVITIPTEDEEKVLDAMVEKEVPTAKPRPHPTHLDSIGQKSLIDQAFEKLEKKVIL